jgi:hypothetical protein
MLLKLPASSGTGAMRAKSGSRSGDFDICYETVKCHRACHFPNLRLHCAQEWYQQGRSSFAQWNRYNPPASPCLRRGKGQPLREEKGEPL